MTENFGSDFITIVDEDGVEYELEILTTLEYNGFTYLAVIPADDHNGTIRMEVSNSRLKEDCPQDKPEYESYMEEDTLNSMVPLWQRSKKDVTEEEYETFYRE